MKYFGSKFLAYFAAVIVVCATSAVFSGEKYFPIHLSDGSKWKTEIRTISAISNKSNIFSSNNILYHWVDGTELLSGQECKKIYTSLSGFHKANDSSNVLYLISYVAVVGNEYRTYKTEQIKKDKSVTELLFTPYMVSYIKIEPDNKYSHSFKFKSNTQIIQNSISLEVIGYENIKTSFGEYANTLKYLETRKTQFPGFDIKTTIWAAEDIGIVKEIKEGPVSKVTTEKSTSYYK